MGRKGIGKLSVFSIASIIEVYSKTKDSQINGLRIITDDIEKTIQQDGGVYHPDPIEVSEKIRSEIQKEGTLIILKNLRRDLSRTFLPLRKRLARRFSIIGKEYNFLVKINDEEISIEDRGYFNALEYIWEFGKNNFF